ncbi:hypothetical protein HX823_19090 [Pseudomonas sp. P7759]|uniref:hypothetical protein n=1 Tax=Pseudomonas sp. P7759 TaxID=2738831 RepID=UPI0015A3281D|nr:hypothetical protein [Pseudomonas sp. P7759]NWC76187.1 hypothetical protein [Pseudomonas sp. P7759]
MSSRLKKDELNDLINESIKSSIRFNAEQDCITVDGGSAQADQGYYARYANDKDKIIKAAGIDPARVKVEDNLESILIGRDIVKAILSEASLSELKRQFQKGHVKIDISKSLSILQFSDEIASYAGTTDALSASKVQFSNGTKDLFFYVPALHENGGRPTLEYGLKAVSEYVIDALSSLKVKDNLLSENKPALKSRLKI